MRHHTEPLTPAENAEIESPSQSHADRHMDDQEIRAIKILIHGEPAQKYEVAERPSKGPALWQERGWWAPPTKLTREEILQKEGLLPPGCAVPVHVERWSNGMVICFDDWGNQIPELAGAYRDVRDKVLARATTETTFVHGDWNLRITRSVSKEEW